jgi:hypothetical protein
MRKAHLAFLIPSLSIITGCGAPVSTSNGAAACIVIGACIDLFSNTSACTQGISSVNDPAFADLAGAGANLTPAQINCIAGAGSDCVRAKACLDNGMTPAPCSGSSSTCMGNFKVTCSPAAGSNGNNGQSVFDCSTLGPGYTCVAANGNVDCGTASCGGGNATQCNMNTLQECNNGILRQVDCMHFSSTCVTTTIATVSVSHCRGAGPGCSQQSTSNNPLAAIRCDGSVLVSCSDGQEARYDCSQLGLNCMPGYGTGVFGCRAGNTCDPNNFTATCAGNVLTFCNQGRIDTFNCGSAGFTGCNAQAGTCSKG